MVSLPATQVDGDYYGNGVFTRLLDADVDDDGGDDGGAAAA